MSSKVNVKGKLGLDTIKVDEIKHITVDQAKCRACSEKYCLRICPAQVYTLNAEGDIVLDLDGCLECGTCKVACTKDSIIWNYPRGGCGLQLKYG